jgi:hypothetical protein
MWRILALSFPLAWLCAQPVPVENEAKRAALDQALAADVRSRTTAVDNPVLLAYAESVAARLTRDAVRIALVADAAREPVALPAGSMFVPVGLFTTAQDETEFAGALAHGLGHLSLRAVAPSGGGIPLIFMGGLAGDGCYLPPMARVQEREADQAAVRMLSAAGYDPAGLLRYAGRIPGDCDGSRLEALDRAIREMPQREYAAPDGDFELARAEALRITAKPPRRGPSLRTRR